MGITAPTPTLRLPTTFLVGNSAVPLLQVDLQTHIWGLDGSWFFQSLNQGIFKLDQHPDSVQVPSGFKP